ncbi:MAG: hypothetical protein WDO71_28615 [Bacteroidota bacterium]
MKKIVFTFQVFGTISLFLLYVALEMNHGTGNLPVNKNHPVVKEKTEETIIRASLNAEAQSEISLPGKLFTGSGSPVCTNGIIKVFTQAACKAY